MADQTPPRGLIADLVTPLKSDGTIDGRGLERLLDRAIPCVEAAFLASPHAGEGETLTPGQRSELVEKAIVVIRGRIPLMIWVTRETEEKTLDTIRTHYFLNLSPMWGLILKSSGFQWVLMSLMIQNTHKTV